MSLLGEWTKDVIVALVPHPETTEPAHVYRWRQTVALCLALAIGAIIMTTALAWGMIPLLFSGFASVAQVQDLASQQKDIRADQLAARITEARERQCYAQMEQNMPALGFATQQLNEYLNLYFKVTKQSYRVPGCDELIVAKK